jgi:hypothetical protein
MGGPSAAEEWKAAIQTIKLLLGVRQTHKLSKHVVDIFIDVKSIQKAALEETK